MEFRTGTFGGAIAMALVWGLLWALPGGVIEAIDNVAPAAHGFTRQVDMWMQTLGLPGLVAGLLFSALLLATGGRRRFADVRPARAVSVGAGAGLCVGGLLVWGMDTGLSEPMALALAVTGYAVLMGAASGIASVRLFRYRLQRSGGVHNGEVTT